jgi:hypothetical protein
MFLTFFCVIFWDFFKGFQRFFRTPGLFGSCHQTASPAYQPGLKIREIAAVWEAAGKLGRITALLTGPGKRTVRLY